MKRFLCLFSVLVLSFVMTVPAFAYDVGGDDVAPPEAIMDEYGDEYPYAVLAKESDGEYWLYITTSPMVYDEVNYKYVQKNGTGFRFFKYNPDTETWVTSGVNSLALSLNNSVVTLVSYNVYTENGALKMSGTPDFFLPPPPLAEVIQGVTEETMQGTLPGLAGTMKVLVPCGVGLMALLAVLKLFGKRSLIFLR